jgi:hypothetical protein
MVGSSVDQALICGDTGSACATLSWTVKQVGGNRMGAQDPSRVLVLVKAAPQPSRQYGDTVCVAGIDLDTQEPT